MQDALDRYIKYLIAERNASPHTVSNYRREIAQFMAFAQGQGVMAWEEVTPALLRQWLALLHGQGYVKASVVRRISELRAFYTYLQRHDLVDQPGPGDLGAQAAAAAAPAADAGGDRHR